MALLKFILLRKLSLAIQRKALLLNLRLPCILAINIAIVTVSYLSALGLRFDFDFSVALARSWVLPLLLLLAFRVTAYAYWNINQGRWRYSSTKDLMSLLKAHFVSSALLTASIFLFQISVFPRSVIFIEFGLSVLLSGGLRLLTRLASERLVEISRLATKNDREVLVLGAGDSGHLLIKTLLAHRRLGYKPIGVLDDSEWLVSSSVFGVPVLGSIANLESMIASHPRLAAVIVAIPSYSAERFASATEICERFGVALKRVQSFEDIACLDAGEQRTMLTVESVLHKDLVVEHETEVRSAIRGKRVLVTGAGGSIGGELVRQILQFDPLEVILLDNGEFNLFRAAREFSTDGKKSVCRFELGSICDEDRLVKVFAKYRPQLVYHAAAYKHVPLLEANVYEAFRNNIVGTRNLLRVSQATGVERFVLISTDKAVDPISIMGVSKRIAELLTQEACASSSGAFAAAAVRFGNVINSAGSVVPLFKEQILSGGPITVTHPDMERYFMSIREAVRLVLTAGTLSDSGEVYILDMGKPIKIVDLAKKMLALYGRRDIPIVFTGVRPGEKLTEILSTDSEVRGATRFKKVSKLVTSRELSLNHAFDWVETLEARAGVLDERTLIAEMKAFVGAFTDSEGSSHQRVSRDNNQARHPLI